MTKNQNGQSRERACYVLNKTGEDWMPPKSATQHLKDIKALVEAKDEQTLKTKFHTSISHCNLIDSDVKDANKTFHKMHVKLGEETAKNCPICSPHGVSVSKKSNRTCQKPTDVKKEKEPEKKPKKWTKKEVKKVIVGTVLEEF